MVPFIQASCRPHFLFLSGYDPCCSLFPGATYNLLDNFCTWSLSVFATLRHQHPADEPQTHHHHQHHLPRCTPHWAQISTHETISFNSPRILWGGLSISNLHLRRSSLRETIRLTQGNLFSEFTPTPGLGRAKASWTEKPDSELSLKVSSNLLCVAIHNGYLQFLVLSSRSLALLTQNFPSCYPHYFISAFKILVYSF